MYWVNSLAQSQSQRLAQPKLNISSWASRLDIKSMLIEPFQLLMLLLPMFLQPLSLFTQGSLVVNNHTSNAYFGARGGIRADGGDELAATFLCLNPERVEETCRRSHRPL